MISSFFLTPVYVGGMVYAMRQRNVKTKPTTL
jgi:hypothetical protein